MTTIAEISISADELALSETFDALPELEVRVKSIVAEGPLQTMPLVWFGGVDEAHLERALDGDDSIEDYTRLLEDADGDEALYRLEYASWVGQVVGTVFEHDGTVLDAQCDSGRWTLRLLFPQHDSLSTAVEELSDGGVTVDLKRMVEAGRDSDLEATSALTDAQEEAIREAYRRGYYDVPREISLEELADGLGISHQALSERLRRANKVLASEQLDESPEAAAN
ncbi:helix-turn-helix domain-containing protein [Halovivax sp.]|uniref:helix-turn-helix domain-containing protein n=1 Tax=Halovivax sp. TaxID=1935978 RepID=UPI0025B86E9D|nr:helix-turn-helix domain-containing protein [Halovivax sp.]